MKIVIAQDTLPAKHTRKIMMRDTLDHKLDFSAFLIDARGFIPVPYIVTEPALGGFGGVIAPVFITPKKAKNYVGYVPPDITAAMVMYTVNNSWAVGAFRSGSFPRAGVKYRVFAGYVNLNLDYYRTLPVVGEKSFSFNRKIIPISVSVSKRLVAGKQLYVGVSYNFSPTKVKPEFGGSLPDFVKPLDLDNNTASLGFFADWDNRNTIFTPDKGVRLNATFLVDDNWTGSDYNFQRLQTFGTWFIPIKPRWISGLRADVQHAFNDPPFYLLPAIDLRGVPKARYQGVTTMLLETEQRVDLNLRWSVVGFGGIGKAIAKKETFSDAKTIFNAGAGFRYLLARVFKLRAGIDVAAGPDNFGWYIVFGHNWNR